MNKKFLSAILFGALMVTSTGTFVSCKDYDDDIDRIDKELSEVKETIASLDSAIKAGKFVQSCNEVTGGYELVFTDGSKITIKNGTNGTDGAAGTTVIPEFRVIPCGRQLLAGQHRQRCYLGGCERYRR